MQRSAPFARAAAMVAAIAAAMSFQQVHLQQEAMAKIGPYESRGKGQGRPNRRAPGAQIANIRAARKARNVKRHRKACRG